MIANAKTRTSDGASLVSLLKLSELTDITPHAYRLPALPVASLDVSPPFPRSSFPECSTTPRPEVKWLLKVAMYIGAFHGYKGLVTGYGYRSLSMLYVVVIVIDSCQVNVGLSW